MKCSNRAAAEFAARQALRAEQEAARRLALRKEADLD